jgi:uncharacterized protein YyaL (SSP411 family)
LGVLVLGGAYGLWAQTGEPGGLAPADPLAPSASAVAVAGPAAAAYPRPGPGLNLLAREASPYLQLHAHNPVDWYPWGEEAFARARAEDKPIFLSVGYSTCYWCHVMERKVFSDPEIAAFMNAHFISIKVDREERPDVDDIYMKATHLLTGSGGWPNSVFLTPDGRPFYAGTYFPAEDGDGRPGFPRVLRALHDAWTNEREKVLRSAELATQRIQQMADFGGGSPTPVPPADDVMRKAVERLRGDFDAEHGGFGRRTKFPRPPALDLLLTRLEQERTPEVEQMLVQTLYAMALGGIYDHLGDGFHRYSTEPTWSIPHFEKMLYDNAQLVSIYARAYTLTGRPLYRRVVERTLAYLDREMSHPEGGFFSAQDAEVDGEEGASYVWSRDEIVRVLGSERAEAFLALYQLAPMPEHLEFGVLRVRLPLQQGTRDAAPLLARFDAARASLLAQRATRRQPLRDDKVLAAWNGLAIRGLVDAAAALERPEYLRRAERAAHFVLARLLSEEGTLQRSYIAGQPRENGVLDDYAFLADGLLALHEATGDARWLAAARRLADVMLARFEDGAGGGFFLTPEGSTLLARPKPFEDNAEPSGNGVALRVLRTLATADGSERYADAAVRTAASAGALLERAPHALPTMVAVLVGTPAPRPSALANAPAEPEGAAAGSKASESFRLPRSEDHVRARLVRTSEPRRVVVHLEIDEGWHVNANPASYPFLVATAVEGIDGDAAVTARYPEGASFRPAFADEPIQVYGGAVEIPVALSGGADRALRLTVRFQACDDRQCLPPHRAVLALEAPAEGAP